jgi:Ca-activated chloride channel family protein
MIWQNFHYLWFLIAIPLLIVGIWWYRRRWRKRRASYFGPSFFAKLRQNYWPLGNRLKAISLYIGLAFLIVALAGPKISTEVKNIKRKGVNLVVALDLSGSMNSQDIQPSRLQKAKYELDRLIGRLKGSRIGLIVFTGDAYMQSPMTLDYSSIKLYLNDDQTDLMPNAATNFRAALEAASRTFKNKSGDHKGEKVSNVLLIVSDGGNHEQAYSKALAALKKQNVIIYTLGIGTKKGGPIPIRGPQGKVKGYKHDRKGSVVVTKLHPKVLRKIAKQGGGQYYQIASGNQSINAFLKQLGKLQKGVFASKKYADYKNRYQWLAGIGLAFLAISLLLSDYKRSDKVTE